MSAWESEPSRAGADPWGHNAFDPPRPHVAPPKPKTPRLFPEKHDLFVVQKHALDVLHAIRELEQYIEKNPKALRALKSLETDAENTYRVIRSYLEKYVSQSD